MSDCLSFAECRVYPFTPDLLSSPEAWNDEVVLPDEMVYDEFGHELEYEGGGRKWTEEQGGCEGMREVMFDFDR